MAQADHVRIARVDGARGYILGQEIAFWAREDIQIPYKRNRV